jgi:outer membrane biosynthesis protein TonB
MELVHKYWTTPIEAPVIEAWKPQPPPPPEKHVAVKREIPKPEPPKPAAIEPPKPKMISPVFSSPVAKPATAKRNTPRPDLPDVSKAFPSATPNPNSMGSSAIPTLRKPREEVQTGGFGDPNGVPANASAAGHSPNINVKGAYDMPVGPGYGTGGAKGARGVVASTGFGNGVAQPGTGGGSHGSVKQGMFGDETAAVAAPKPKTVAAPSGNTKPVEILFKPKPAYTDEARAKKIEGEVLLSVVFLASGDVSTNPLRVPLARFVSIRLCKTARLLISRLSFTLFSS